LIATGSLDTEDGGNKKQFYEFMSSSYRHFLAGDDPKCEELEAEMLASYKMKEDAIIAQQAKTAAANAEVLAEIQRIKSQPSPLVAAQQKLAEHNSDAEKFQKLIENLQQLKQSLQRKLVERQEEVKAKQDRMARVQAENEALRVRVATQPMNKADLNRMIMERTRQKEVLEAITGQCEEMERKVHQQEVQVVAEGRALDASASRYNQLAHRLKLIPASAKRADGITFELRINRVMEASTPSDLSNLDLKGVIRPALERLGEQYRIKAVQLSHDLLSLKQQVASGKEAIAERAEENKSLELQILHKESMLKAIREAQEGKVREEADRAEVLKREVDRLRNSASLQQQEMEARKRAATSDLEALQR
jgi:kinetochore protein NDC80